MIIVLKKDRSEPNFKKVLSSIKAVKKLWRELVMYRVERLIRTCEVTVDTVKSLEELVRRYLGSDACIKITITDGLGEESFSSFKEYNKEYFQDSIQEIRFFCTSESSKELIRINLNKFSILGSRYELELLNKDKAMGASKAFNDIFDETATMNWLVRWDREFMILHGITTGLVSFVLSAAIAIWL